MRDPILRLNPVMTIREICWLEGRLLELALAHRPLHIFEWGSGGSTVYFPEFLRSRRVPFSWVAVEHDPRWQERVDALLAEAGLEDCVRVKLLNPTHLDLKADREYPMGEYVGYAAKLGRPFDVAIVDGRRRRRCLLAAARVLKPHGCALLHDAGRPYYHPAFSAFPAGRMIDNTTFWEGSAPPAA